MSNLRTLLYDGASNRYSANTNGDDTAYSANKSLQPQGCVLLMPMYCQYTPDSSYEGHCMCNWCAPTGTSSVTFEIWGGGGGGAGACCCQQGQPGGSGAYAKKTVTGTLGGCCWNILMGYPTDCAATCCGIIGCQSYVTGFGLSNFCAEGGFSGRTQCFTFWGNFNCAGNNNGNVRLCYTETDCRCYYGADEGSPGRPGYLWAQCSCNPCNWKYIVPFPGGLVNKGGGFTATRVQGNACNQEWLKCIPSIGYSLDTNYNFLPGRGGMSATSCGGGCCYGFSGNPGFARITYS